MSAKPSVAMSPAERRAFLAAHRLAVVCSPDGEGRLIARVAGYQLEAEALHLELRGAAADLPASQGACALVDTSPSYREIKGAILRGKLVRDETADPPSARLVFAEISGFDFSKAPERGSTGT
jgi:hypothetical protein